MARYKTQRGLASILLYVMTGAWLALWLAGWFLGEQNLTQPAFYVFWTFLAASLVFMGLRGAIEE